MGLHSIEICAGVGMLGEGLRAGLRHMGIETRVCCYVEREAYAAAVLAARIEEGSLDQAPIWSDLLTFDAAAWHGAVDCIVAGFPCQDLSLAGKRAGLDGARSGLFFDILDIADACGARGLFLENVSGIASATSTVVDEAASAEITGQSYRPAGAGGGSADDQIQEEDGAVLERAAARVLGELADRGWHAEWLTLSASDVGASHGRARWFCWAWRELADGKHEGRRPEARTDEPAISGWKEQGGAWQPDGERHAERRLEQRSGILGDTTGQRCRETRQCGGARIPGTGEPDAALGHATQHGRREGWTEPGREQGRPDAAEHGGAVADSGCSNARRIQHITGTSGCAPEYHAGGAAVADTSLPFFAPGPADPAWRHILQQWPELAPALEPDFRGVVDGVAFAMDESRAQRLKCVGNGVVPLQAAAAAVVLIRRARGLTA